MHRFAYKLIQQIYGGGAIGSGSYISQQLGAVVVLCAVQDADLVRCQRIGTIAVVFPSHSEAGSGRRGHAG